MDAVINDVATQLLNLTNSQILAKSDVFNDIDQTQIKIGKNPTFTQSANSILINATGLDLSNTVANSCVIKPIRDLAVASRLLSYNDTSGEVVASTIEQVRTSLSIPTDTIAELSNTNASLALKANLSQPVFSGVNGIVSETTGTNTASNEALTLRRQTGTASIMMVRFQRTTANTQVGSIYSSSTATVYNTSSDYRLKDVIGPINDASSRLLSLKPIRFSWKSTNEEVDGFLAHEVQEVIPEAITGEKDAVDEEGNPEYQSIDHSKLVPLLCAALQNALKRIEILETQINNNVV
jgi:hypothetical protein